MNKGMMLVALMGLGLCTTNAWAYVDIRTQPGMNCRASGTSGTPIIDGNIGLANSSTASNMQTFCPIVRDDYSAPPTYINVSFLQNNPNQCGSCGFGTTNLNTGTAWWGPLAYTCGHNNIAQTLPVSTSGVGVGEYEAEFLVCYVPASFPGNGNSAVEFYEVQE